jgi:hypothetical protein
MTDIARVIGSRQSPASGGGVNPNEQRYCGGDDQSEEVTR